MEIVGFVVVVVCLFVCLFVVFWLLLFVFWWGEGIVVVFWDGGWELRPVKQDGYMTANLRTKERKKILTPTRT